jgi:hypothetical protein
MFLAIIKLITQLLVSFPAIEKIVKEVIADVSDAQAKAKAKEAMQAEINNHDISKLEDLMTGKKQ